MVDLSQILPVTIALTSTTLQHDAPIQLSVSVRNMGNQPLTLLNWKSPLDPKADILGVFQVHDVQEGNLVDSTIVKFSRKLPPPREDLVEIPANEIASQQLKLHPMKLIPDHDYIISTKGNWQAVWQGRANDVTDDELQNNIRAFSGEFKSGGVAVKAK